MGRHDRRQRQDRPSGDFKFPPLADGVGQHRRHPPGNKHHVKQRQEEHHDAEDIQTSRGHAPTGFDRAQCNDQPSCGSSVIIKVQSDGGGEKHAGLHPQRHGKLVQGVSRTGAEAVQPGAEHHRDRNPQHRDHDGEYPQPVWTGIRPGIKYPASSGDVGEGRKEGHHHVAE